MNFLTFFGIKKVEKNNAPKIVVRSRPYNPFMVERNFPNGLEIMKRQTREVKYVLENGKLTCYKFGVSPEDEDEAVTINKKWYSFDQTHLQTETPIEAVGILEKDIAEVVDTYIAESRQEDNSRIETHRKEVREILRKSAINPLEITATQRLELPIVFLYTEMSAKTQVNGSIGFYLDDWKLFNSKP